MSEERGATRYDLEERTLKFAQAVIEFVNILPKTLPNTEVIRQVVRSAGSVGANYIEANEALGVRDFAMRVKISRKEAKETAYWLKLLEVRGEATEKKRQSLIGEATELTKILSVIVGKARQKN